MTKIELDRLIRAADVFLPERLVVKLRRFWRCRVDDLQHRRRTVGEIVQKGQTLTVPGPRTLPSGETNDSWTRV